MDIEASSEITVDESDAFEESTTHERDESYLKQKKDVTVVLPSDAWQSIVHHMSVCDVGSSLQVCKTWRTALTAERIWKVLCARYAVPEKKGALTYYAHFCLHAKSIVGPTLSYRQPPNIMRVNLPSKAALELERAFEERRCTGMLFNGQEGIIVVDEMSISLMQLQEAPFRCSKVCCLFCWCSFSFSGF